MICPAQKDERGYTRAEPEVLASGIAKAIEDPATLSALGEAGHAAWKQHYTWDAITTQYEAILQGATAPTAQGERACEPV